MKLRDRSGHDKFFSASRRLGENITIRGAIQAIVRLTYEDKNGTILAGKPYQLAWRAICDLLCE